MALLEKSSNPNMYCYLLSKKQYPYLIKRLIAQVNRTNGHSGFSNWPCLKNLMEENDFVLNAVFKVAQRGNPGAVKFGAAYLAKYGRPITDIGIEIVSQQYIKTGDRSLIDPFYNKSLFTASQ